MKIRTRLKVERCACSFPVGIHGKRCVACCRRQCLPCTRNAEDRSGLCLDCDREYQRDLDDLIDSTRVMQDYRDERRANP